MIENLKKIVYYAGKPIRVIDYNNGITWGSPVNHKDYVAKIDDES